MLITIRAHHVSITAALKEHAQKKIEKLERFFTNIQEIIVELDVIDSSDENDSQIAMATVYASGTTIRAKETSKDLYASLDMLCDKIEGQLKKYKDKLKDHKGKGDKRSFQAFSILEPPKNAEKNHRHELKPRYVSKPMYPEDAAYTLDVEHLDFLVFRNAESDEINVIYPLASGEYGLIEP